MFFLSEMVVFIIKRYTDTTFIALFLRGHGKMDRYLK